MRELILLFLIVVLASFCGAAAGSWVMRVKDAADVADLRLQVEPSVCRLFTKADQP